jgi:hypothetical protein
MTRVAINEVDSRWRRVFPLMTLAILAIAPSAKLRQREA